jgi:hypothetical protein
MDENLEERTKSNALPETANNEYELTAFTMGPLFPRLYSIRMYFREKAEQLSDYIRNNILKK